MILAGKNPTIVTPSGRLAVLEALENNWYEGSRWSPNRSWVWYPVQDARKDLDRFTRYELSKHARYLYKNSPLIRGVIERMVTLVFGSGFHPVFRSASVEAYGPRAKAVWNKKARNIHLGPKASFSQYTRATGRARFIDGESFTIKTGDDETFENKVQGVESDRVTGGSSDSQAEKTKNQSDGLVLNKQNKTIAFKFREVDEPYPAEFVIHHFTPMRLNQFRGETSLAAAINTARDVDDILALEKQAVKEASSHQDIIKTTTGELNPESFRTLRYNDNIPTVFNLPADDRTKDDYYKVGFGGKAVILKTGDEYTPYVPNRPGSAWEGFMAFLANTICLSTGFPASVILPVDVGGTDIRRDLDIAQRVAAAIQLDVAGELDEIVDYLMAPEYVDGALMGSPQDRYLEWHFPQKINVDRQTAQQDRQDVQAGLMSKAEYHGRYGDDGDAEDLIVISEAKKRKDRIIAAGFKDTKEFVEILSLDPKMFMTRETDTGTAAPPSV